MLKAWQERRYNRYNSEEDVEVPTSVRVGAERTNCRVHAMGADTAGLAVCMCVCLLRCAIPTLNHHQLLLLPDKHTDFLSFSSPDGV